MYLINRNHGCWPLVSCCQTAFSAFICDGTKKQIKMEKSGLPQHETSRLFYKQCQLIRKSLRVSGKKLLDQTGACSVQYGSRCG